MSANNRQSWTVVLFLLAWCSIISACSLTSAKDATPSPTLAVASPAVPTPESTGTASPTPPSPSPKIDFPLALNNTWVYQATRYQGYPSPDFITTTLVITETVVELKSISNYLVAKIHRDESAEMPVVIPPSRHGEPLRPATASDYWLVVSGNRVYRQENQLDLSNLDEALLEFVFPLKVRDKWYQSDTKAKLHPTPILGDFMLRHVTKVGDVVVPAGRFNNCFFLQEEWAGTTFETWFCPNVGIVDRKVDHHGTPEGFHQVLIRYQLKE